MFPLAIYSAVRIVGHLQSNYSLNVPRASSQTNSGASPSSSASRRTVSSIKPIRLRRGNQHRSRATTPCKTLLWIDDYAPGLEVYKAVFKTFGYRVLTACDGQLGLQLLQEHTPDAVIVDYEMPGMDGATVAAHVKRRSPELPVVMFSGCSSVPARVKNAVTAFCEKNGSLNHLRSAIDNAVAATA